MEHGKKTRTKIIELMVVVCWRRYYEQRNSSSNIKSSAASGVLGRETTSVVPGISNEQTKF
jgi:LAS superfamily LD-carboxypeptidase LdcB